jgi:F-type H+-transporting ATPase subunit delta
MDGREKEYALAVFALAKEQKSEQALFTQLTSFCNALDDSTRNFFRHPKITKQAKKDVLSKSDLDKLLLHLLFVLVDNRRFEWLDEILKQYEKLLLLANSVLKLVVTSKTPLSQEAIESLQAKYALLHSRTVQIETHLDATLLGGLKIEYDGYVEDRTINRYLSDLTQSLKG